MGKTRPGKTRPASIPENKKPRAGRGFSWFAGGSLGPRLHLQVVVYAAHATHAARNVRGALDLVLRVDEAVELHDAVIAVDVDIGGGADPRVRGERGLHLRRERCVAGGLAGGAALAARDLVVMRGTARKGDASGHHCCCK